MPQAGQIIRASDFTTYAKASPATTQAVVNSTAETVVGTLTIPANEATPGSIYRMTVFGVASVTAGPLYTLTGRVGGVAGTLLGTLATTASPGAANKAWTAELDLVCLTTGVSGTWAARFRVTDTLASATSVGSVREQNPTSTITVNSTVDQDMVVTWTWGTASPSNSATRFGVIAGRFA
ncbi:hypothetical protein [Sphaerisporangium sp. NPDC051011]|uniref:hypothetical protein n=1 Tax=Sphaerisporangium sp. NPDC051011 TaxID=3155792 RepID=UPI0034038FC5